MKKLLYKFDTTHLRTDRRTADNKGLKEMAGTVVSQTFVHLINSCGMRTVCASKSATSLSPEPLCAILNKTQLIESNQNNLKNIKNEFT